MAFLLPFPDLHDPSTLFPLTLAPALYSYTSHYSTLKFALTLAPALYSYSSHYSTLSSL